jgi:hypothetical protein
MLESNFENGPPETSERYTLYPATFDALGVQLSNTDGATEGETADAPVPEKVMVAGEFVALLASVTLPGKLPAVGGVKVASNFADCPGVRIKPAETPLRE